eukprot:352428-Chlamydomonas_euryale.AAC.15
MTVVRSAADDAPSHRKGAGRGACRSGCLVAPLRRPGCAAQRMTRHPIAGGGDGRRQAGVARRLVGWSATSVHDRGAARRTI